MTDTPWLTNYYKEQIGVSKANTMKDKTLTHRKHMGSKAELQAIIWLLDKGYDVFSNVSSHGYIDLIAINTSTMEICYFDVKTAIKYTNRDGSEGRGKPRLTKEQIARNIKTIYVYKDGEIHLD